MGGKSPNKLVRVICASCGCEFYIAEPYARSEVFCTLRCSEHREIRSMKLKTELFDPHYFHKRHQV